jgi:hypothetical protein
LPTTTAVIDSGWNSDVSRREISAGTTERFKIHYTVKYKGDTQDDDAITVQFAEGCAVQL